MSLNGLILSESEALNYAHQVAKAAACLDDLKNYAHQDDPEFKEALTHVDNMHNLVILLAGAHLNEVYNQDDQSVETNLITAAGYCVCANT